MDFFYMKAKRGLLCITDSITAISTTYTGNYIFPGCLT